MEKIKVIDLLNKIANGEEIPNKIIWNKLVYDLKDEIYFDYCGETLIGSLNFDGTNLNDEVEIIEEDKKIEKIKEKYCSQISKVELAQKINEIIDYINEEK